ncbi:MAG: DNA polymerase III subunit gamma and tau [Jatrophihabitans sp.]|uniref:DNA polymerase III subunit gamma and tau n=1 Tax=Jatrophihabitans sp. TaxID=1932789 RepID=UPI0039109457
MTDVEASAPPYSTRSAAGGSSLALYRKYRSSTFAEVIGQDHVTVPLRQALAANRINHAYLFSGPRGCGKTSSARILARSLNCIQGPTPDPCGVCDSCTELAPNGPGSIDVIEIDAASHGGVDDARDLRERAFFAPVRDRFKVYIVDEAHMVSNQGFNALLKLVEEPPDFLVFVFATTEPDKVLTTIRSRTHHYPFRLIPPTVMRAHLETICTAEGIAVEPAVLPLVVRAGGGSARDSLSILDQLLAGAGPDGVTYSSAIALLGVTDGALLDDMVDALAAGDAAGVYGTVDRVVEAGHDPRRFSVDLLDRFRDLILLDAVPDAGERGLIDVPQDQLAHMANQALRLGGASLTRYAEIVHTALIEMRGTTAARLVLELLCARMMLPDASTDAAAVLQRVERLERRLAVAGDSASAVTNAPKQADKPVTPAKAASKPSVPAGPAAERAHEAQPTATVRPEATERPPAVAATAPAPATESATTPVTAPSTTPGDPGVLDANALRRLWPEVLEVVKLTSRRTRALLDNAQITEVSGELVTLAAPGALAKMIGDDSNTSVLRAALTKIVGGEWKISVDGAPVAASAGEATRPGGAAPAEEPDPRDDAEYEPAPRDRAAAPQNDPEAEAMKLLRDQLGARPLEG